MRRASHSVGVLVVVTSLALLVPRVARAQWPDRLGPFWVGNEDARVRPSLFLQLQGTGETIAGEDMAWALRLRRIRPILRGSFLHGRVTSTLHIEVSPDNPELIDAFIDGEALPALRIRVGQFKTPFTQYYQQSLIDLAVDWPMTSRWFGGERQLGVMAYGGDPHTGLGYAVGAFAGQNRRSAFARDLARVYGERLGNPSSFRSPAPTDDIHPELVVRLTQTHPDAHPETGTDTRGGGLRHVAALSFAWDTAPVPRRDWAVRVAPELLLKWEHFSLNLVAYGALIEDREGALEPGAVGLLAELGWLAHRHVELVLRYGRVHLLPALLADARAHAAAMRPDDPASIEDWSSQYGHVGDAYSQQELSLAVQVLVIGRSLAWQTDVAWLRSERAIGARDDLRLRTQIQLSF
jgi:hypothetical protein